MSEQSKKRPLKFELLILGARLATKLASVKSSTGVRPGSFAIRSRRTPLSRSIGLDSATLTSERHTRGHPRLLAKRGDRIWLKLKVTRPPGRLLPPSSPAANPVGSDAFLSPAAHSEQTEERQLFMEIGAVSCSPPAYRRAHKEAPIRPENDGS